MSVKKRVCLTSAVAAITILLHCSSISAAPHKTKALVVSKEGGWGALEQQLHLSPAQKNQYDGVISRAKGVARAIAGNHKLGETAKQLEFAGLRTSTLGQVRLILTSKQQILLNRAIAKNHF